MFRLNGNIVKQLENIYHIRFFNRFKNDLKERILFFIEQLDNENKYFIYKDEKIICIKEEFFFNFKEELLNLFNPLWFKNKKIETNYSKRQIAFITDTFIYHQSLSFPEFIVPLKIAGPHNPLKINLNYDFVDYDKVVFSNKLIRALNYELKNIIFAFLNNLTWYEKDSFRNDYFGCYIIPFIENFDFKNNNFIEEFKNKFSIDSIKNEEKLLVLIFRFYYLNRVEKIISKIFNYKNLKIHYKNRNTISIEEKTRRDFVRFGKTTSRYNKMFKELNSYNVLNN